MDVDDVVGVLKQLPITSLALLQSRLGLLSLGNVEYHALPAERLAVLVLDKAAPVADPCDVAVRTDDAVLEIDIVAISHRLAGGCQHTVAVVGVNNPVPNIR